MKKIKFFLFVIFLLNLKVVNAEIYEEIKVEGNERLSAETVIMFSGLKIDADIEKDELNSSIKKLYQTDYFKNIIIETADSIITIKINENPIIQTIKINGVKNKSILEKLTDATKKSEKYPYLKNNIIDQKNFLLNTVRSAGFYFAEIDAKIINNRNNSVNIIYEFNLGNRAIIKKINFQGNKIFKDSKLRNVIKTEEGRFWKFITSDKYLDERKIKNDENLLKKYYQKKGFYNVDIKSSYVKNIDNQYFELIFNINANDINTQDVSIMHDSALVNITLKPTSCGYLTRSVYVAMPLTLPIKDPDFVKLKYGEEWQGFLSFFNHPFRNVMMHRPLTADKVHPIISALNQYLMS